MSSVTPFLWFDTQAEEAAQHYTAIFRNSRITATTRYPKGGPSPEGSVMTVSFELDGVPFIALNAGPHFQFNHAVSFMVECDSQDEIDHYWERLSEDGATEPCGWLKDKFGLSWQVTPRMMMEVWESKDEALKARVMAAMMQMSKLDIQVLQEAAKG